MSGSNAALQDLYPDGFAHCFGCGRDNEHGHRLKTHWIDGEGVARFTPRPEHLSVPGFVYGGLLASLVDCHSMAVAAADRLIRDGKRPGVDETPRFVTGRLEVDYRKPTPIGVELEIRGRVVEAGERKAVVESTVSADGVVTVTGRTVAVRVPDAMAGGGG